MAKLATILDIEAVKLAMREIAEIITTIKKGTRRRLTLAAARGVDGHRITRAKYTAGRPLTSEEGSKLAMAKKRYTMLCILRAAHRGHNHVTTSNIPAYMKSPRWWVEMVVCSTLFSKEKIVGKNAKAVTDALKKAEDAIKEAAESAGVTLGVGGAK